MNEISSIIEFLLVQHDCVIVPNLGGFVLRYEPARVGLNRISPPLYVVGFNGLLTYHDGLLAEVVMRQKHLDYSSALLWIEQQVQEIKQQIALGHSISLGKLGVLSLEHETYTFSSGDMSFLPRNLGQEVLHLYPYASLSSAQNEKTRSETTRVLSAKTAEKENTSGLEVEQEVLTGQSHRPKTQELRSRHWWHYAAVGALIIGFSIFSPNRIDKNSHEATISFGIDRPLRQDTLVAKVISAPIKPLVKDMGTPKSLAPSKVLDPIQETEDTIPSPKPNFSTRPYQIIVASLSSRAQALQYISETKTYDKDILQIVEVKGKYRVSTAGFYSRKSAVACMDSLRGAESKAAHAWVCLID